MNANDNSHDVADLNIERLLSSAYNPESADPAFARRVEERLLAVASTAAHARTPNSGDSTRSRSGLLGDRQQLGRVRFRLGLAMGLAAAAAVVAIVLHGLQLSKPGSVAGAGSQAGAAEYLGEEYLTPRKRPEVQAPGKAMVGEVIRTKAGERRRTVLPDGSVLYVNQNTTVALDANRRVKLEAGEVFVEVAPRGPGNPFIVKTGEREVTAIGTKFAVRADREGKGGVVVTQGKVKVGSLEITAGQQLELAASPADQAAPAPRASAVLDWTRELMAAAESPLVPDSKYTGGALVAVDPNGQEAKLTLRHYRVDVHIEDGFARTIIDQTYFNHNQWRMEGTFYFPLPADAQLSRLAMYVDGKLMEGGMAERDYARGVYEEIVYSQKDPALLEWVDGSTFKMRVFPLESRQEKRIIIGYVQRLSALYGRAQYRFPAGHSLGLVKDWQLNVRVKNGAALGWSCDSHDLKFKQDGKDLLLTAHEHVVKLDRDVVVDLIDAAAPRPAADKDVVKFATALHEGNRYVMLRYRPELLVQQQRQQRDWVFLFESSGDRDPLLARVQIDVIRALLANAEHYDTFAIVMAGTRTSAFRSTPVLATPENVKAAVEYLESAHLIGALDLDQALAACTPFLKDKPNPHLVHVGSGIAALGERRHDVLAQRIPEGTRYVGVGVGKRWARDFMKTAAERSGGYFTQINPDEPVSWRAFELSATLNTPRLMDVRVTGDSQTRWLAFGSTVAQGEELAAVARFGPETPLPAQVTVSGTLDGKPFAKTMSLEGVVVDGTEDAGYLPRTWAKLEIDRLLAEDSANNREAVVALSKSMYVMSPYTSLLVLENEEMYQRFKVDRGRKDHWAPYVTPKTIPVLYEPEVGQPVDARFAPKTEKPHVNQVQSTVLVRVPPPILTWPGRMEYGPGNIVLSALDLQHRVPAVDAPDNTPFPTNDVFLATWAISAQSRGDASGAAHPSAGEPDAANGRFGLAFDRLEDLKKNQAVDGRTYRQPHRPLAPGFLGRSGGSRERMLREGGGNSLADAQLAQRRKAFDEYLYERAAAAPPLSEIVATRSGKDLKGKLRMGAIHKMDMAKKEAEKSDGDRGADAFLGILVHGGSTGPRLYTRPAFSHRDRVFFDLASYAPGMTTSSADIQAVVEAEAMPAKDSLPGQIDPAARKIIDRARTAGWSALTVGKGEAAFTVVFDGQGRHAYERALPLGLKERVVCDGRTLLHLYDELGIGARRTVSRFHRDQVAEFVPWLVAPAEDLARGADVRALSDNTIALVPRDVEAARDDDGKPVPYVCFFLKFGSDGGLAERQIVELPGGPLDPTKAKVLLRESYDRTKGVVQRTDDKGEELSRRELKLAAAQAPNLTPDTEALVVLPLPYRLLWNAYRQAGVDRNLLFNRNWNWFYQLLDGDTALALFASEFAANNSREARQIYDLCFSKMGVKKIGFFTLLASCGQAVSSHPDFQAKVAETPNDPLVAFLALHSNPAYEKFQHRWGLHLGGAVEPKGSFLQQLSAFHDLYLRWQNSDLHRASDEVRRAEELRAINFVRQNRSVLGWSLLTVLQDRSNNQRFYRDIADTYKLFDDDSAFGYAAQYEHARSLYQAGREPTSWHHDEGSQPKNLQLVRKLDEVVNLRAFDANASLKDVLEFISDRYDLPLAANGRAFAAIGIDIEKFGVTLPAQENVKLGIVLQKLIDQVRKDEWAAGLTFRPWTTHENMIEIAPFLHVKEKKLSSDRQLEAAEHFTRLYQKTLQDGILPPLDGTFRSALQADQQTDRWTALMRQTADKLKADKLRTTLIALAWQCYQLGDVPLAENLVADALRDPKDDAERLQVTLVAIEFLIGAGQHEKADSLLTPLLGDAKFNGRAMLWRLGSQISAARGQTAPTIARLERALEIEYQHLPQVINLQEVRSEYSRLLSHYEWLAGAASTMNIEPPRDLLARTIRAADRWRALDRDSSQPCEMAARILKVFGARDLAWDYLTTPIGSRPNEAGPWQSLGQTLSREGDLDLADRAFRAAFAAEPTDAQILWEQAQNLRRAGKLAEANRVLRRIADSTWQPRFNWLKSQARWQLEGR
jgi:thioredoxin-like negative regulator of GroEL